MEAQANKDKESVEKSTEATNKKTKEITEKNLKETQEKADAAEKEEKKRQYVPHPCAWSAPLRYAKAVLHSFGSCECSALPL